MLENLKSIKVDEGRKEKQKRGRIASLRCNREKELLMKTGDALSIVGEMRSGEREGEKGVMMSGWESGLGVCVRKEVKCDAVWLLCGAELC